MPLLTIGAVQIEPTVCGYTSGLEPGQIGRHVARSSASTPARGRRDRASKRRRPRGPQEEAAIWELAGVHYLTIAFQEKGAEKKRQHARTRTLWAE